LKEIKRVIDHFATVSIWMIPMAISLILELIYDLKAGTSERDKLLPLALIYWNLEILGIFVHWAIFSYLLAF